MGRPSCYRHLSISIHAPSRERLSSTLSINLFVKFQSTLPRGSDHTAVVQAIQHQISIHAPSRERLHLARRNFCFMEFQSTLPRGSDRDSLFFKTANVYFNPRSLAGATDWIIQIACGLIKFQSTLPRGSDPAGRTGGLSLSDFNPRSLAGATYKLLSLPCV